jgi:hypothetical protein
VSKVSSKEPLTVSGKVAQLFTFFLEERIVLIRKALMNLCPSFDFAIRIYYLRVESVLDSKPSVVSFL